MTDPSHIPHAQNSADSSMIQRIKGQLSTLFHGRFMLLGQFILLFLIINAITRTLLLAYSSKYASLSIVDVGAIYGMGLFFDLITSFYFVIPAVLYLVFIPDRLFRHRFHKSVIYLFLFGGIYTLCYGVVAEWLFWDEFGKRFNFIAVDYLVYTTEVVGNIMESYPVIPLLCGLVIPVVIFFVLTVRTHAFKTALSMPSRFKERAISGFALLMLALVSFIGVESGGVKVSDNVYNNELSRNGLYELFAAFRNNDLDFGTYYDQRDDKEVLTRFRDLVKTKNSTFVSNDLSLRRSCSRVELAA